MARAAFAVASGRPPSREQRLGNRLQLLGSTSVAYAVLALVSGLTGSPDTPIAEIWLPAGLSAALAVRVGCWALPVPLLGTLLAHLAQGGPLTSVVWTIALSNSCGTALMVGLSHLWMRGLDLFASLRNVLAVLAATALAAALATGLAAVALPNLRDWSPQGDALGWWGGSVTGTIVLAPVLLSWMGRSAGTRLRELRRPEFALLLLCCLSAGVIADLGLVKVLTLRPQTLLVSMTLWSGLRFSPPAATLANLLLALGLALLPDQDRTLLQLTRGIESQELLQLGLASSLTVGLVVLVISNNRTRASRQLTQLAGSLERTVAERTEQLAKANAQLRRLSETDGLTGLANRRHFDALLRDRWCQAAANGTGLALALIDVDHFKLFNDRYGHPAGDHCLQQVGQVLAGQTRSSSDCAARYGGEEFVLLWSDVDVSQAAALAERLRLAVSGLQLPHAASPVSPWVSLSIGVAAATPGPNDVAEADNGVQQAIEMLLLKADQRLYEAKAQGRNRVVAA